MRRHAPMLALAAVLLSAALSMAVPAAARAAEIAVDLELVLAVDASDSMDDTERALQKSGYVAAFRDKLLIEDMLGGPQGRIAVTYVEWGDSGLVEVIEPWAVIASPSSMFSA